MAIRDVPAGWAPRAPAWVPLAPGIEWLIQPTDGAVDAAVQAEVARVMAGFFAGRAALDELGLPTDLLGELNDLETLAGLSVLVGAIFYGRRLVEAWRGMADAESGADIELTEEALTGALFLGPPEGGAPLWPLFMAHVQRPSIPIAADCRRLRELARWEHGGGAVACAGCAEVGAGCARNGSDAGDLCPRVKHAPRTEAGLAVAAVCRRPGLWKRAGMAGVTTGLEHAEALALARLEAPGADEAALARCLAAYEAGALEGEAERAKREN